MRFFYNNINYIFYLISKYTKIIEKRFNISLYFLSIFRIIYLKLEKKYTFKLNPKLEDIIYIGNYFIKKPINHKKMNIISGGIGKDISFDQNCIKQFNVNKLIMIDPTEVARKTTESIINNKNIFFINKALYSKIKQVKIYHPHENVNDNSNLSIENLYSTEKYSFVETITLDKIKNDHKLDNIDILKLDVEGVADKVILDMFEKKIFPDQICFELEKPLNIFKQFKFFKNIKFFLEQLKVKYTIYNYTSVKKGYRIELLAIKK